MIKIKNSPKSPKNKISFPLEEPIRNTRVIGLIIGLKMSVIKSTPANNINMNPANIILFLFIKINLSF